MCGHHRLRVLCVLLLTWVTSGPLTLFAQTGDASDSGSLFGTLVPIAAVAGMGWLAWLKRADLHRIFKSLIDRVSALIPARLRGLLGQSPSTLSGEESSDSSDEDVETKVVQRGTFGLLIGVSQSLCGKRWPIPAHGLAIGRDPRSDIVVDDARVSAHHAQIRPGEGGVIVIDTDSRNGVFLNTSTHRVVGQELLRPGDIVMLSASDAAQFVYSPLRSS